MSDYESEYMRGQGRVLLRDKVVAKVSLALLAFFALWCGAGAIGSLVASAGVGLVLFLVAMSAFFAFLALTLTVVRVVVSEGELYVQYGLWGPRIPIGRIRSCRAVPYDWKEFGGWGIKRSGDGTWAYVTSSRGDVVEVTYDEGETQKRVLFSASDPRSVVAAVEEARAKTGVRIGTDARVATEEEAEEESSESADKMTR